MPAILVAVYVPVLVAELVAVMDEVLVVDLAVVPEADSRSFCEFGRLVCCIRVLRKTTYWYCSVS